MVIFRTRQLTIWLNCPVAYPPVDSLPMLPSVGCAQFRQNPTVSFFNNNPLLNLLGFQHLPFFPGIPIPAFQTWLCMSSGVDILSLRCSSIAKSRNHWNIFFCSAAGLWARGASFFGGQFSSLGIPSYPCNQSCHLSFLCECICRIPSFCFAWLNSGYKAAELRSLSTRPSCCFIFVPFNLCPIPNYILFLTCSEYTDPWPTPPWIEATTNNNSPKFHAFHILRDRFARS